MMMKKFKIKIQIMIVAMLVIKKLKINKIKKELIKIKK